MPHPKDGAAPGAEAMPGVSDPSPFGGAALRLAATLACPHVENAAAVIFDRVNKLADRFGDVLSVFDLRIQDGDRSARFRFTGATIDRPIDEAGTPIYPADCRANNRNYSGALHADAELEVTYYGADRKAVTVTDSGRHPLGRVPVFVGSRLCNTYRMTPAERAGVGESRTDPGGYPIIRGQARALRTTESLPYNAPQINPATGSAARSTDVAFFTMISKPGDSYENSAQLKIFIERNGAISVLIAYKDFANFRIPFAMMFRLLGVATAREIFALIAYDSAGGDGGAALGAEARTVVEAMRRAFAPAPAGSEWAAGERLTDQREVALFIGWLLLPAGARGPAPDALPPDQQTEILRDVLRYVHSYFLPHVGGSYEDFPAKAQHLALYVRELVLVASRVLEYSDRDNYATPGKRQHTPDVNFAKEAKTQINHNVIEDVRERLTAALGTADPANIRVASLLANLEANSKLENGIAKAINSGEKASSVGGRALASARMSTERVELKTNLSAISAVRSVRASNKTSKKTTRADEMRRVHATYFAVICPFHGADSGEQVGVNKGITLLGCVSGSSSSRLAAEFVRARPEVRLTREHPGLREVFVNGLLVGFCERPFRLRAALVAERRRGALDRRATIAVNSANARLNVWCDFGRPLAPFVVVENTLGGGGEFAQWPRVQRAELVAVLQGRASWEDLERAGRIEYLSPEELVNCFVAEGPDQLWEARGDRLQAFTHMLWDRTQLFAVTTLTSPYPEHSQPQRITYQTQQRRSALSKPVPERARDFFWESSLKLQMHRHRPAVRTLGDVMFGPASETILVAMQIYNGVHAEDSVVFNRSAVDRGTFVCEVDMTFAVSLKRGQNFTNPLAQNRRSGGVEGVNEQANYDFLDENGIIKPGSPVRRDTVLVGVVETLAAGAAATGATHRDRSYRYRRDEVGYVQAVTSPHQAHDQNLVKVRVRTVRPFVTGDKVSARSGNKGICGESVAEEDLPVDAHGHHPTVLFNSLSFPTREVVNQMREAATALVAARLGRPIEATAFHAPAGRELEEQLVALAQHAIDTSDDPAGDAFALLNIVTEDPAVARRLAAEFSLDGDEVRRVFSGLGKRVMYDPHTGNRLVAINMSPAPLQRLNNMVVDKAYAVMDGRTNWYTHQPAEGKKHDGGLRFGEMERDVLLAHGSMEFFDTKMYKHSSGTPMYVCRNCMRFAANVNASNEFYLCQRCPPDLSDVVAVSGDWAAHIMQDSAQCMGIGMRPRAAPDALHRPAPAAIVSGDFFRHAKRGAAAPAAAAAPAPPAAPAAAAPAPKKRAKKAPRRGAK
jgi:DNA-directed RNA polymerase beta subunit